VTADTAPARTVIGFGANLGDRLATMRAACAALARAGTLLATSHVYETAPIGPPQPRYLNAAALLQYAGTPDALLDTLLGIEQSLGRVRVERWAPRTVDLDILWIEGRVVDTERLVVPHPRLHERAFAVVPLLELVPHAIDPRTGSAYLVPEGDVLRTGEVL
jgi:2-amino-4-hydroxy-6-hydroxymethyldihydropteridine diphosphokinase